LGPLDQITTDAGKNFASQEFRQNASIIGTKVKIVPVEAYNFISKVERYYAVVCRAYSIITNEIQGITKEMALQMAFKAINNSISPNGLVLTLLVYSVYPRMTENDPLLLSVSQQALAIKKAMAEVQKLQAKR